MSFAQNFQREGRTFHGGYWSTFDGNNYNRTNRKRSRHNYFHKNCDNDSTAKFGEHDGSSKFYNVDHANYMKYDAVPSSLKRRKYSVSTWDESWRYCLPPPTHDNAPSAHSFRLPLMRYNADTSTSACCKRDISRFEDDEPIFMSRDEIDRCSPSRKDGIDVLHETHLRYSYCAFLQNLGMRLELPQATVGTAMVLCHRFFVRRSHACHDRFLIATASLFLAAKSEETPRPLNNVLRVSSEILHKQDFTLLSYRLPVDWFEQYRERVLQAEQLILTTLNFELNVQHPFAPLTSVLNKLGLSHAVLVNLALNLVSEGLRSSLWLQFKPHHIAAGAAHLAAKFLNMDLSACRNIWQEFETTPSILQDVTQQLMELF
ncbi:cyclin-T1-4-like isoform X1 [Prosopis cineraria]|uniref:cyclin-T1-4-like isoform X1 n=1 Tax=Prosopis cineraria TaxID=364024 RepID=UPI00240FF093|nr:cyclin-T1-4-like isoform X1 [Prosopis cineraria]